MPISSQMDNPQAAIQHRGPNLGVVAVVFTVLKLASLFPVTSWGLALGFKPPWFPLITESPDQIVSYFASHTFPVALLAFLQFGAAIPLGIFTACAVSRLRFLGVRAAGADIALFGGLAATFDSITSALLLWVLSMPGMTQDATLVRALHVLSFGFGGPGYAVPIGLLMAGVSVTAGFAKSLPKWIVGLGLFLALAGELSWLAMIFPALTFLIPLTRFPGLLWMIAAGFALPTAARTRQAVSAPTAA